MKSIKLYDKYILFSDGRLKSLYNNAFMKPRIRNNKPSFILSNELKQNKSYLLQTLMATHFIESYDELIHKIVFKDGDSLNCSLDNICLESIVPSDTMLLDSKIIENDYILYQDGTIFSKKSKRLLTPNANKNDGFISVNLNNNQYSLHVLVATHFNQDYDPLNDLIQFTDNDKSNCDINNLEIVKLGFIRQKNDELSNAFFESQDPYKLARLFLAKRFKTHGKIFYNNSFDYEDLIQTMVIKLYNSTPSYLLKYNNDNDGQEAIQFNTFATHVFSNMFDTHKSVWHEMYSFGSIVEVSDEIVAYEHIQTVDTMEAIELGIIAKPNNWD